MDVRNSDKILRAFLTSPSYLKQSGWLCSMECGEVIDENRQPIPWLTYPALDFLRERVCHSMAVFEYGSGNSTLWWSERVYKLVSCEHDKEWYAKFRTIVPEQITYIFRRCKGGSEDYAREITHYRKTFDILVLDGRERVKCAINGVQSLRDNGVILWDNADREEYLEGYDYLQAKGFKRLDFWGLGPLSTRKWCTSVFYRSSNCLRI